MPQTAATLSSPTVGNLKTTTSLTVDDQGGFPVVRKFFKPFNFPSFELLVRLYRNGFPTFIFLTSMTLGIGLLFLSHFLKHGIDTDGLILFLLIVAILEPSQLKELLALSMSLWMQCLVEVHDQAELETALEAGAEIIGINNRDLRTFKTDLAVTERLAPLVPRGKIIVSESGINSKSDMARLGPLGVSAVLVGEALVTAPDVAGKVRELTGQAVPH